MESSLSAGRLREMVRTGQWTKPTSGVAAGYVQANLVMLPKEAAFDFLLFCVRNPKPCPILDVLDPGQFEPHIAPGADLRTDLPLYRIFENGRLKTEARDVRDRIPDRRVFHGHVVKRAVGLDVLQPRTLEFCDGLHAADLDGHHVPDLFERHVHIAPAETDQIREPRMRPQRRAAGQGQRHGFTHHSRIAGVVPAGDVG